MKSFLSSLFCGIFALAEEFHSPVDSMGQVSWLYYDSRSKIETGLALQFDCQPHRINGFNPTIGVVSDYATATQALVKVIALRP